MNKDNSYQEQQYEVEPEPYQNLKGNEGSESPLAHLSDGLEGQARTAFISKVYSLLSSNPSHIQYNYSSPSPSAWPPSSVRATVTSSLTMPGSSSWQQYY